MKNKFKKLLSVVLSICMLLSVCFISGAMTVSAEEKVLDYYVKGNGTGDGSSASSPAPTVKEAIRTMVSNGLTVADTANVWIMQDAAELYGTSSRTHNLAYWGDGNPIKHANTIVIKPHKDNTYTGGLKSATIMDSKELGSGNPNGFALGGPTVFENVRIVYNHKTNYQKGTIVTEGNNLTINPETVFAYINGNSLTNYTSESGVTSLIVEKSNAISCIRDSINVAQTPVTYTEPYVVSITHKAYGNGTDAYFFGDANAIFKENATLIFDSQKSGVERVHLNSAVASYSMANVTSVYEKDINIKLRNVSSFAFRNDQSTPLTIWGGINMIVSDSCGFSTKPEVALAEAGFTKNKDGSGNAPFWVLTVGDGTYNNINFYGETGKFQLDSNCTATATHSDSTVVNSDPYGVLDLSAKSGKWKVVITVNRPKVYDYYVKPGGTGDGTDINNPAPDVATAISTMNTCNLNDRETANIWIMQDATAPAKGEISGNKAYHNMAFWSADGLVSPHDAKIIVKPYKTNPATTYLFTTDLIGDQDEITLGGPTEFQDLKIVFPHSNDDYYGVIVNGKDFVVGSGVSYGYVYRNGNNGKDWDGTINNIAFLAHNLVRPATYTKSFKVTFNNNLAAADGKLYIPANDGGNYILKGDVTVDLAGGANLGYIGFGTKTATSTITYEKNLNLKVNGGTLRFRNYSDVSTATIGGGLQFIIANGTALGNTDYPLTNLTNNLKKADGSAADMWTLKVDGDKMKYVDFIEGEAGKFNIASNCGATVTKADDPSVTYTVGEGEKLLDLSGKPGEYIVDVVVYREKILEYYVGFGGTGDGSSLAQMAPDVATAIATMNSCRLAADEVATIYVVQNITKFENNTTDNNNYYHNLVSWGATVEHENKIVVKPYKENAYNDTVTNTYIATSPKVGDNEILVIGGPTEFSDIAVVFPYGSNIGRFNPVNANGNDLTYSNGTTFRFIPVNSSNEANWDLTLPAQSTYTGIGTAMGLPNTVYTDPMRVTFNVNTGIMAQTVAFPYNWPGASDVFTFKKDVTLDINGANGITVSFGTITAGATATFEKNVNIKETASSNLRYDAASTSIVVKGGLQVISNTSVVHHATRTIENARSVILKADGTQADFWKLNVAPENIEYVDFIEGETGKFKAFKGERFLATASNEDNSVVISAKDGVLDLSGKPGTYTVTFKEIEIEDDEYESFINYRGYVDGITNYNGAMANTYKKLRTEEELNIVYFGGSVTAGSGSTDGGSWRERIGDWMVNNFPSVKINNIDQAIGETGTYLGVYRVARDIITKNPDVLFVEYSINDYYDKASYDRASMQYETIVRNVKEAHPDCDIVTVLVTDVYCARSAANGNLHTQAQAHEDIAQKYNIPTLHVGRALATHVVAEGWTSGQDAVWAKYVKDIVHPLNTGYDIYYKVIKEFMCNTLLFGNYGEYEIADQVLPATVNKYLRDGEVTYIDEQDVPFTTEGGAGWHDMTGLVSKDTYAGLICVPAGSQDTITVDFEGTELIMLVKAGNSAEVNGVANTFQVSMDGGATWVTHQYEAKNPIVVVTGLEGGKHTAIIKPASLTEVRVGGFYSRNAEKATNRLNITDLVHIDETYASNTTLDYRDYNNDNVVDAKDVITAKKMLLNNK